MLNHRKRVIARRNLPARPPLELTGIVAVLLVAFQAPTPYWWMAGALIAVLWISFAVRSLGETEVDIIDEDGE